MSEHDSNPIGVFDSGLGGLSVLRAVKKRLPDESFIYVADSLNAPYGKHNQDFITKRTLQISKWLVKQRVKAILIACNTATTQSISIIRQQIKIPIIGIEPGIKPAIKNSKNGIIGIIATRATLNSVRFTYLIKLYSSSGYHFICNDGHGLVEAIETGNISSRTLHLLLYRHLKSILDAGSDVLVLGCTHYPFLAPIIHNIVGKQMSIIDTTDAVANQTVHILNEHKLHSKKSNGSIFFYSTKLDKYYLKFISSIYPDAGIKHIIIS
ncbi:MAG: glutamate racemase [Burkholderia sp.]|nr:glutamate racemase [Burkholderia sp.]